MTVGRRSLICFLPLNLSNGGDTPLSVLFDGGAYLLSSATKIKSCPVCPRSTGVDIRSAECQAKVVEPKYQADTAQRIYVLRLSGNEYALI